MTNSGKVALRIESLITRYKETYGDELTRDEVSRYINGVIIDRQRAEMAIFDHVPTSELFESLKYLDGSHDATPSQDVPKEPEVTIEEEPIPPVAPPPLPVSEGKKRGRPVGWRKAKA